MWSVIEQLPEEVRESHVFAMLASKDIPKLDGAVLNKKARLVLQRWYRSVALITSSKKKTSTVEVLSWCIKRGLHMTTLDVSNHFQEALHLILSKPTALTELLVLQCANQEDFDAIQNEIAHLPAEVSFTVQLELATLFRQQLLLHSAQVFNGRLSGFTWDVETFSAPQASLVLQDNPKLRNICIRRPTYAEIGLVCSLRSLLKLTLNCARALTDAQLVEISNTCTGLQHLSLHSVGATSLLDTGLVALAESCTNLQTIDVLDFAVSDAAVTALCAHCPKLTDINIPAGYLTSAALLALSESGARWQDIMIGWNVRCASVVASTARIFCDTLTFRLNAPNPACEAALSMALASMPSLVLFSLEAECFEMPGMGVTDFPTQHLLTLAQNSPQLVDLWVSHPVSGAGEDFVVRLVSFCPRLQCLCARGSQLGCNDSALLAIAAHCPRMTSLHADATAALTDAGVAAIAERCPDLQNLTIARAERLTDAALGALAKHSRCLRTLELTNSPRITEIAQLHLLHRCPKLLYLRTPESPMNAEAFAEKNTILQSRQPRAN
jgi:hypothetical protein